MAAVAPGTTECPVCHEDFCEPKLLACTHLVCRKCVLSWLQKGGDQAGCPLCREPILPASQQGQDDLAAQVDALPTDFATAALVESEKTLSGSHVCSCGEDAEATLFCLQCAFKLCSRCAKTHAIIPATRDHVTEKLSDLSAEQLASHHRISCGNHGNKQAEVYCVTHDELVCVLCLTSTHCKCSDVKEMVDVAEEKREELKAQVKKLEDRETAVMVKVSQIDKQMQDAKAKFKAMKEEVKAAFDDLQMSVEAERQKLNLDIQQREDTFLAERKSAILDLENYQAALSAHKSTVERLVSSAPDNSLLGMMGKLKSRLTAVESQVFPDEPKTTTGSLTLNSKATKKIKEATAAVGKLTDSSTPQKQGSDTDAKCFWCGSSLSEGPGFASVIKVGDRVRGGKDWHYMSHDGSGTGTVTDVAADLTTGGVTVRWDCGNHYSGYRLGRDNCYDLKRA